ncbi:MAG: IS3 family transposase [Ruminococcus sp.]|nr:IS3 family transposase [Ruminococcus sp.]
MFFWYVCYNTKRIKLKLDGMSPVEYRLANAA